MNLTITGKDLKVTDAIREYVEKKLARVQKYFDDDASLEVKVTIKQENNLQVAEFFVSCQGTNLKASADERDLYASIDKDIDILEGQIRKQKAKKERSHRDNSIKQMQLEGAESEAIEEEIIKVVHYSRTPMTVEDAQIKLSESKDMLFLPFLNSDSGDVEVIYKKGNNYGIVEPE